jgi:hemolysin III
MHEETANSITHGIGLALSVAAAVALLQTASQTHDAWTLAGCGIYALTMVAVYAASTLSHVFRAPGPRQFFRILDQACIYLLIAGTYTPFGLTYLRGGWWWLLLSAMWLVALLGVLSKTWLRHRVDAASAWTYVLLGWLPITAAWPITKTVPGGALRWMLLGGLLYTLGTVFLTLDSRVRYFHSVWHLLVIAAGAAHFWAIYHYVAGFSAL